MYLRWQFDRQLDRLLSGMALIRSFVMGLLLHADARVSGPDRD